MKNKHRTVSTLYSMIFFVLTATCAFSQQYDPLTGELIESATDSITVSNNETVPLFDPETGEIIQTPSPSETIKADQPSALQAETKELSSKSNENNLQTICSEARVAGAKDTQVLWYLGGVAYLSGFLLDMLIEPTPPVETVIKLSPYEYQIYAKCYKEAAKKERITRMLSGCGVWLILVLASS